MNAISVANIRHNYPGLDYEEVPVSQGESKPESEWVTMTACREIELTASLIQVERPIR
jgi:hypothetical protein